MAETPQARASAALAERELGSRELEHQLEILAGTLVRATSAETAVLSYRAGGVEFVARTPNRDFTWQKLADKALAAMDAAALNEPVPHDSVEAARVTLTPEQLAPIVAEAKTLDAHDQVLGAAGFDRDVSVSALLIAPAERPRSELEASLELAISAVLAVCQLHLERTTSAYWRERAAQASADVNHESKALDEIRRINRLADDAACALLDAPAESRSARLGELVAASASFEDWLVARKRDDQFIVIAAARRNLGDSLKSSTLAEALMTHRIVARDTPDTSLFPRRCAAIAIEDLIIALSPVSDTTIVTPILELLAKRLAPIVRLWNLEAETTERRSLIQRMALRMFAAVDEERARIARDLHDDQAQLLAAAEIALEGGREQAGAILKQVETELRRRTRELRPASLGQATLAQQIEREMERLTSAGIAGRFVPGPGAARMARPVQQLCYQLTREALSNVIRHAQARSVQVRIDCSAGVARVSVADDGRGMHPTSAAKGSGLAGLRERVELMGGTFRIDSTTHGTTVTAEIPEPSAE
jgi:signal transduction histidine kinase